jgi:hypothetical protein
VPDGLPDCEKFVTKFPPRPFTQPRFPWLLTAVADVLQTSNWTLYGPLPGVPVKLRVRVKPFPVWAVLVTAQPQLPVPPHWTEFWPFWKVQLPLEAEPPVTVMVLPPTLNAIAFTKKPVVGPLKVRVAELVPTFKVAV